MAGPKTHRGDFLELAVIVEPFSAWEPGFSSLLLYAFLIIGLVAILLFLSGWLGEHREEPEKLNPYESGIIPTGSARFPYPVSFYLVAAFFLIFDVEAVYIFAWAIAAESLGWLGWLQISFFIIVLLLSLFYLWSKGGLEWGPTRRKPPVTFKT
jgi:NADH-quinone oxidoreductase subunit A